MFIKPCFHFALHHLKIISVYKNRISKTTLLILKKEMGFRFTEVQLVHLICKM